jgi:hypothetical protein
MVNITVMSLSATRRERWVLAAVIILCLLVLVFSFAAKLSLYQPHHIELMNLSAAKMRSGAAQNAIAAIGSLQQVAVLLLVSIALRALITFARLNERICLEALRPRSSVAYLSVSHLRAPPVR